MKALGVACSALATALAIAACGGTGGLIPASTASTLRLDLARISADVANRDCPATTTDIATANNDLNGLPSSVNATLRSQLQTGLTTLTASALKQCQGPTGPTGATASTGSTGPTAATSATSATGATSSTSSTSSTASTTSTETSSAATTTTDTTSSAATTSTDTTSTTCTPPNGEGGGTPACDGVTSNSGIGGPGQ